MLLNDDGIEAFLPGFYSLLNPNIASLGEGDTIIVQQTGYYVQSSTYTIETVTVHAGSI